MRTFDLVICGGGPAGQAAARAYREAGGAGTVLLVTREDRLPYARPALSKEYLRGELSSRELALEGDAWYAAHEIVAALRSPVRGLDPGGRLLLGHETIAFETAILATGASPATIPVPGGADPAVLHLRDPHDSDRIRAAAATGTVTVIGSGFIGCEVAASLALTGAGVRMVGEDDVPQAALLGEEAGRRIGRWLEEAGVELELGSAVQRIDDGRRITLANGREIVSDSIVLAAGIVPNTALAALADIEPKRDRIPCDSAMRTTAPRVLVAGDAAFAWNDAVRRRLVVQHWGEADRMGQVAGRTAAGESDAWAQAPGFWSTIGEHTIKHVAWGDGHDETRLLQGVGDDVFAVLYGRDGTLVGVLSSELDDVYEHGRELVESGAPLDEAGAVLERAASSRDPAA